MNNQADNQLLEIPQKQSIVLDTCLLLYLGNKNIKDELLKYLAELLGRGFDMAISEVTIFELLSGAHIKQEQEGFETLKLFKTFQITSEVLVAASQLSTLYREEKIPQENSISLPDKIIASTTTLTGSLILTADVNDYPRPFFIEAEIKYIFYFKNSKQEMLNIQLLRPDYTIINKRFNERPLN